ncbi:MAG TPA: hypothetical protein VGO47_10910, partial [Chlamydiales bacterium]|nr:hypothetical protein [Chlamydiales bacterium]
MYMSYNVLAGRQHTYIDDLESFYYVLVEACLGFTGPHSRTPELPLLLFKWFGEMAATSKEGHLIQRDFDHEIQSWWGEPFRVLIEKFHEKLHNLWRDNFLELRLGQPAPSLVASTFYASIL